MATFLYKRHDCIFKDKEFSTPIHKTLSAPQITRGKTNYVRHGIVRKQGPMPFKKLHCSTTVKNPKPLNLKRRRSVSLTNLSLKQNISEMARPCSSGNSEEKKVKTEINCENIEPLAQDQCNLARHVYKMFILNAWRHCRHEATKAINNLKQAETQMDNLNIQIVVLRNLLESEKNRVAKSMNEAAHYRVMLEDEARQKDKLKSDMSVKENVLNILEETLQDTKTECLNIQNELLTCKSEQNALEDQMEREREKLSKFKEDKKLLLEKLKVAEESNAFKQSQLNKLVDENEELKQQLQAERETNKTSKSAVEESLEKLEMLEESRTYLTKEVTILKGTNFQLVEKIKCLEVALNTKDKDNISLTKSCQEQMLEMCHLRVRLNRQETKCWTTRLSHIATFLVQVPISVLFHNISSPLMPA